MIEEKEEIWIAEVVVTAEMIEEVAAVKEEAAVVEIEEVVAVQEVAVAKVEEVEDLVVVVEVAVAEEQVGVAEEPHRKRSRAVLARRCPISSRAGAQRPVIWGLRLGRLWRVS